MKPQAGFGPHGYVLCNVCGFEVPEISSATELPYRLHPSCRPEKIAEKKKQVERKADEKVMRQGDQPKRKRGRPRIHPLPDPNAPVQPKRKRGRPRKIQEAVAKFVAEGAGQLEEIS